MVLRLKTLPPSLRGPARPREARGRPKTPSAEAGLSRAVRDLLALLARRHPLLYWRANSGTIFTEGRAIRGAPAGTPDYVLILPPAGRAVGVELKAARGRQTAAQRQWQAAAAAAGGLYWLVRDVNDLRRLLAAEGIE
jgi:hypothetical protein